jgi:hypothetical protein
LQPGCHQVGASLHFLDHDQGRVEQRDDAWVVPQCIHSRVHLVKQLDPEYPLLSACALIASNIDGAGHLLEVWPCGGGEACRQRILGQERLAQCCEARRGGCLVFGVGACIDGDFNVEVCDNLVGGPAAVAGLERRQRLDLLGLAMFWNFSMAEKTHTFGFFLNMMAIAAEVLTTNSAGYVELNYTSTFNVLRRGHQ